MALPAVPLRPVAPRRLPSVAWLASVLVLALAVLAAPAQARHAPVRPDTGGVEVLEAPDDGGTAPGDPYDWPVDVDVDLPVPLPSVVYPAPLPEQVLPPPVTTSFVAGKVARVRTDGKAAIPRGAPKRVRSLISQYNRIVGQRYRWGGGHTVLEDKGYDCSGAVGYGLIRVGMLRSTMVSGSFARWAAAGPGRWVTVYANRSHVYTEIAGLRLDTSPYGDGAGASGVRWRPVVGQRTGFKLRHPVGL
jgi:hypothetical protein